MTAKEDESNRRANRFSDNTCGHPYDTGRRRGVERAAWWPCHNSYLERVFRANAAVTSRDLAPIRIGRMAKRGAPEPEPDPGPDPDGPTSSSIGPFLGALAVLVVLVLVVFGAQLFSRRATTSPRTRWCVVPSPTTSPRTTRTTDRSSTGCAAAICRRRSAARGRRGTGGAAGHAEHCRGRRSGHRRCPDRPRRGDANRDVAGRPHRRRVADLPVLTRRRAYTTRCPRVRHSSTCENMSG